MATAAMDGSADHAAVRVSKGHTQRLTQPNHLSLRQMAAVTAEKVTDHWQFQLVQNPHKIKSRFMLHKYEIAELSGEIYA